MVLKTKVLLDGLWFPECPRWHERKLWFSDMRAKKVMTVDLEGHAETIVEVQEQPAGLGWLPDGRLLVVSMHDRRLMRLDPDGLVEAADLRNLASYHCNDMVVDRQGRAYIGNFGFNYHDPSVAPKYAEVVLVTPDGNVRVVADEMAFPNGSVITPDGRTFIVAETGADCLTAFDIEADGSLTHRHIWAHVKSECIYPDGICLDAEGAIWVAFAGGSPEVLRVLEGGEVTHRFQVETQPYAVMLGGPDRQTLFVCTSFLGEKPPGCGRIETVQVDVPGAGLP